MTRTAVQTDTFTGSDGSSLGANWTNLTPSTTSTPLIFSNMAQGSNGLGLHPCAVWSGSGSFTNDQYAKVSLIGVNFSNDTARAGVILRASTDTDANRDYYQLTASYDGVYTLRISKCVNGTFTDLVSTTTSLTSGDILLGEVIGTTLNLYINSPFTTPALTTTDSSLSTGKPGLVTSASYGSTAGVDNWEGGTVTSTPTANQGLPIDMGRF